MFVYNLLLIVQIIVALSIIGLVLIQHGKGADAGAAFGGGSSGTVFGSRGSGNFLSRSTGILAAVFFANSLGLAWLVAHRTTGNSFSAGKSVVPVEQPKKVKPAPTAEPAVPSDVPTNIGNPEKTEEKAVAPVKENETPADVPTNNTVAPAKTGEATPSDVPVSVDNSAKKPAVPADVPQ